MTSEEYLKRALDWSRFAIALREDYAQTYGDNGGINRFPISGGICDHWPRNKKDNVIKAVRHRQKLIDLSLKAWKAIGRRRITWLRLKYEVMGDLSVSC